MDAEEIINLIDYCWFEKAIFGEKAVEAHHQATTEVPQEAATSPTSEPLFVRSQSEKMSPKANPRLELDRSPVSVLTQRTLPTILSELPTILSEEGMGGKSKSLTELEFEELKGFMDLGFVFSEEDRDSRLASLIPGLQRFGKTVDEPDTPTRGGYSVSRPYLSEAWADLNRKERDLQLMNWRFPALSNEVDKKDNLRWWAHTVASTVR